MKEKSTDIVGMSMFLLLRRVFDLLSIGIMLVAISCRPEPKSRLTNTVLYSGIHRAQLDERWKVG